MLVWTLGYLCPSAEGDHKPTVDPGAIMSCNVFISWNMSGWSIRAVYLWLYRGEIWVYFISQWVCAHVLYHSCLPQAAASPLTPVWNVLYPAVYLALLQGPFPSFMVCDMHLGTYNYSCFRGLCHPNWILIFPTVAPTVTTFFIEREKRNVSVTFFFLKLLWHCPFRIIFLFCY